MATVEFEVKVGSYKINGIIAEHWGIKIGEYWYEVEGASKGKNGEPNNINRHKNDAKYSSIKSYGKYRHQGSVGN